ncbi:hypothetical protein FF099_10060 [Aquisalinus flavus]|nr:hypothetical protein FF099_10060 [Aquisalinus flavus]
MLQGKRRHIHAGFAALSFAAFSFTHLAAFAFTGIGRGFRGAGFTARFTGGSFDLALGALTLALLAALSAIAAAGESRRAHQRSGNAKSGPFL